MASYKTELIGDFDTVMDKLHSAILAQSTSASFEDGVRYTSGDVRVEVRVYERYSAFGGNRVSMTVTLCGTGRQLFLSGITSGGSQAMFFKLNTVGEDNFLETLVQAARALPEC